MKKETKIALTAVAALVLLFIGINFLKGINVFQATNTYYVKFKDIGGLAVSNPVYANGYPVGIVRGISYDYQRGESVVVSIELNDEMKVPRGTYATLEPELMGGIKMSLLLGKNPTLNVAQGDTISGDINSGAMSKVAAMIPAIENMLPKLDSILTNINRITADPSIAQLLQNTAALTADLKESTAQLNVLMHDDVPQLMASLKQTGANAEQVTGRLAAIDYQNTVDKVNATLASVQDLSSRLDGTVQTLNTKMGSTDNSLGLFLNDRSVYDNLNSTISHADSLMTDLKAHPKRYVHFSVFGKKDK